MKRIVLTAIVILGCFQLVLAQSHPAIGIKGGLNFANLSAEGEDESDTRTSFHIGLLSHFHLNKNWAIQPELMYSSEGANYPGDIALRLGYINLPILGQYMFGEGFRIETGPQFGLNVGAKTVFGDVESDVKDEIKGFGMSWAFGAGYLSPRGIGIDARYNLGLTDISESGDNIKSNVWQVGLFYQFGNLNTKR